jgi:MFS family permease
MGVFAGSVYVLGFTLLQEYTDDELRGRVFTTLLTLVRMCVLLALMLGPVLATIFNGFAKAATGATGNEVPTASVFGFEIAIPGVRLTLWLASIIIVVAGVLAARSMQIGVRERLRSALGTTTTAQSKDRHPTTFPPEEPAPATFADQAVEAIDAAAEGLFGMVGGPQGTPDTAPREAEPSLPPLGELTSEIAPLDLPASMRPKPRERKDDL